MYHDLKRIQSKKYGMLSAIKFVKRDDLGQILWLFRCDCGKELIIDLSTVTFRLVKDCGCKNIVERRFLNYYKFWHKLRAFINRKIVQIKIKKNVSTTFKDAIRQKYYYFFKRKNMLTKNKYLKESLEKVEEKVKLNPRCYLTGRPIDFSKTTTYHFDHILPVSRGGDNSLDNLGITCAEANKSKGDRTLEEHLEYCKDVVRNFGYDVVKK